MAGGIRSLDSFMENYSEPAWLDEKPQSFASALKDWQQIQNNYYKNDKAKMELEDKEESREKKKEREKKMLELGLTLDPDDLRGSLRKVIDFSNGEGDINTSLSIMGRLYQMDQADKREREAAARKALGITKKEQKELEKKAREVKTSGYLMSSLGNGGLTSDAINNSITLAAQDGNWRAVKDLADLKKSVFGTGSKSSGDDDLINGLINGAKSPQVANNNKVNYSSSQDSKHRLKLEEGKQYFINGKLMAVAGGKLLPVGE